VSVLTAYRICRWLTGEAAVRDRLRIGLTNLIGAVGGLCLATNVWFWNPGRLALTAILVFAAMTVTAVPFALVQAFEELNPTSPDHLK
jgi:hypothetical protein